MDAVEYVKQRNRMCDYYTNCGGCPASGLEECSSLGGVFMMIPIVEQWAKEHPVKTRQSELLKLFPETEMIDDYICICPSRFIERYRESAQNCNMDCEKCKRDFWLKEIE